jgi:hypothetical protein
MSIGSHRLVDKLVSRGAVLTEIEDSDILGEFLDWGRCLSVGLESPVVFGKVYGAYQEAQRKREEHNAGRINETLQPDETSVLFMREGHHLQFPADIQVFYVAPPTLDAIQRALRERQEEARHKHNHEHEEEKTDEKAEPLDNS